jgi:hypothetical protein
MQPHPRLDARPNIANAKDGHQDVEIRFHPIHPALSPNRAAIMAVRRRGAQPSEARGVTLRAKEFDHLLVSNDRDARGLVDVVLDGLGRRRRIVAIMPQLILAFAAASRSDAIITTPLSAALFAASVFPVALHEPPINIPGFDLSLLVRRDGMADPAIVWLSGVATEALAREHPGHVDRPTPMNGARRALSRACGSWHLPRHDERRIDD